MSNLIDEITQADQKLEAAEAQAAEASRQLRRAKRELKDCRQELRLLIKELKTGQSCYPIFERISRSAECEGTSAECTEADRVNGTPRTPHSAPRTTPDEHQRGPTVFPEVQSPEPAKGKKKPATGPRISTPSPTTGGQVR
jgi:hypothetical protein